MNTYIGSKIIKASPMNRADYNTYRGWEVPEDENPTDEGFLVEYLDGGISNHSKHEGYISWSPASVFHGAYKPVGNLDRYPDFLKRVYCERAELESKLQDLNRFLDSGASTKVSNDMFRLMAQQAATMRMYSRLLGDRIAQWHNENAQTTQS